MDQVFTFLVSALFGIWFLVTLLSQFTWKRLRWLKRHNSLGLIPGWTFFAPKPGTSDYSLVFRDILADESVGDWKELQWCSERLLRDAVWHPSRHRSKFILDCINALMMTVKDMSDAKLQINGDHRAHWMVSVPYLALAHLIINVVPRTADATARQFAIIELSRKPDSPPTSCWYQTSTASRQRSIKMLPSDLDIIEVARVTSVFFAVGFGVSLVERFVTASDYGASGWIPWTVFRFDRAGMKIFRAIPASGPRWLFGTQTGMRVILSTGLLACVLLALSPPFTIPFASAATLALVVAVLLQIRSCYAGDGAHQMQLVVAASLAIGFSPLSRPVAAVAVTFIAAQCALAYCASGVAKLVSPYWMKENALQFILATRAYGSTKVAAVTLRQPKLMRMAGVGNSAIEAAFPIALLCPLPVLIGFLFWGVCFHTLNALIMGLNAFWWAFLATYPCVIFVWTMIHGGL